VQQAGCGREQRGRAAGKITTGRCGFRAWRSSGLVGVELKLRNCSREDLARVRRRHLTAPYLTIASGAEKPPEDAGKLS
jgi:hypothetical protein